MPSARKRIGFLPRSEVHDLIEKICKANQLSQSKVTGILVEEALRSRGILKSSYILPEITGKDKSCELIITKDDIGSFTKINSMEDFDMISDFLEYKFFKNVVLQKTRNIKS